MRSEMSSVFIDVCPAHKGHVTRGEITLQKLRIGNGKIVFIQSSIIRALKITSILSLFHSSATDDTKLCRKFWLHEQSREAFLKPTIHYGRKWKNKAGYTAQDAPSIRTFQLRK